MNPDQETFYKCMMDRAKPEKQQDLKFLLLGAIEVAEETPFSERAFDDFKEDVLELIKPETYPEIQENLEHFRRQST